jgi:hypothetical protein
MIIPKVPKTEDVVINSLKHYSSIYGTIYQ